MVKIPVLELVRALERSAQNTDTDWRWLAAAELRRNENWQTASIVLAVPRDAEATPLVVER